MKLASGIMRTITGAYILNSGIGKLHLDAEAAAGLQEMAATGIPQLGELDPEVFGKFICASEIGIGASLLTPFIPRKLAGLALTAFASGMLTMYFRNPAMTEADGIRRSQEGLMLSKDVFMLAIGLALITMKKDKKAQ